MIETLDVDVHREDGFWVAVVPGIRGGATEVRRLANLETEVRDLISGLLDADPAQFDLRIHFDKALSSPALKQVHAYMEARSALNAAKMRYELAQRDAVYELRCDDVSLRDAGTLLGVSFQRVQQLANAE